MKRALCLAVCAVALARGPVRAQAPFACDPGRLPTRTAAWQAPLDRTVTLHAGTVSLAEALTRITTAARLRLSYSRDLLPADRRICLEFTAAPVGAVLGQILNGTSVAA